MRQLPLPLKIHPELGFKEFHPGPNREAVSHLIDAASGKAESLIYLWGGSHVGKSHLLNAFCKEATPNQSVALLDLRDFAFQEPKALEGLEAFDAVCLDNLDAISGSQKMEHAVFVLFNRLRESGRSLIVSANGLPNSIGLELDDLRSRLSWGLTLHLEPLNDEALEEALCLKAKAQGLELSKEVCRYLTHRSHRTIGELLKLLDRVDVHSLEKKRKITIPLIRQLMTGEHR